MDDVFSHDGPHVCAMFPSYCEPTGNRHMVNARKMLDMSVLDESLEI